MADGSAQASGVGRGAAETGPDPLLGRMINERFKVVALVARGGMGKVYRAEQAPLGRTCALKVLNPKYAGEHDPEFHKRFFLEASIASKLTHPNTVTIFDYGRTDDDIYYMAMEYLEGRTLHRAIREEGSFNEERAAHVARQVCRSLREAHSIGVIHRDLKPANIFLVEHADEHDFVKVLDFGLVKNINENKGEDLTQAGLFMGSPKYMAPEQIKGDKVDSRTDIYALGVIMYEMLTGKVPFDRPNSVHIMMAHVNEPPPPLRVANPNVQVSQAIQDVVFRCLEKDPDRRWSSMEQLLNALKGVGGATLTATLSGITGGEEYGSNTSPSGALAPPPLTGSGPQNPLFLSPSSATSQSGPIQPGAEPDPSIAPEGKKGSRSMVAIAVGIVAIAGIAAAAVLATRSSSSAAGTPSASATAETSVPSPSAPVAATGVPSAAETSASFKIETDPSGATVKSATGLTLCENTPCEITFKGDDAADSKEHKLTLVKDGFKEENKTVKVGDKKLTLKLAKVDKSAPPLGPPRKGPGPGPGPTPPTTGGSGSGFKEIPY